MTKQNFNVEKREKIWSFIRELWGALGAVTVLLTYCSKEKEAFLNCFSNSMIDTNQFLCFLADGIPCILSLIVVFALISAPFQFFVKSALLPGWYNEIK